MIWNSIVLRASWSFIYRNISCGPTVYPDVCEMLALLTWTYSFRFRWSWAIFRSSGHSVTSNRGTWRQPPDTNAVVLDISHLHLGRFVNFYRQRPRETNEAPAPRDKTRLVFVSSSASKSLKFPEWLQCFVIHFGPFGSHLILCAEKTHMGTEHVQKDWICD